jgi:hypothetical protein
MLGARRDVSVRLVPDANLESTFFGFFEFVSNSCAAGGLVFAVSV